MEIISDKSAGVILPSGIIGVAVTLNCRFSSFMARSSSQGIDIRESYVSRIPLPNHIPDSLAALESSCIALKRWLMALDLTERSFAYRPPPSARLTEAWQCAMNEAEAVAAMLHTLEGISERKVFAAYGIASADLQAVLDETGTPAGWFPLLAGYDVPPSLLEGLAVDAKILKPLVCEEQPMLSPADLADLKRRLCALYQAGPGLQAEDEASAGEEDENDEEEQATAVSSAHIPIPAETLSLAALSDWLQ